MPLKRTSRFSFCKARKTADGMRLFLTERTPYRFVALPDNIQHTVVQGDTLHSLAFTIYEAMPDPEQLWWAIGDFQPDPIFDPTVTLELGRVLFIPSLRTLNEIILSERRRRFL